MEYDYAIIGSGFGGSVSALRLAQKGYKTIVIEQGREVTSLDMEAAQTSVRRFNWMPELGMEVFFPRCLTGCPHNSKNTLDKNYLYLARRLGVQVLSSRKVTSIAPLDGQGYVLTLRHPIRRWRKYPDIRAKKVILSAGVLGTLSLLFHCRNVKKSLPNISDRLGTLVRTNSEAIVASLSDSKEVDLTHGTAISSHFYPDSHTHITQNRFPQGYTFMKFLLGPLVDHERPGWRAAKTFLHLLVKPHHLFRGWFAENWHKRMTVLTVMQSLDNQLALTYGRKVSCLFRQGIKSKTVEGHSAPAYLPVANKAARILAEVSNGIPMNVLTETLGNTSTTAHILGGCHMGMSRNDGVIDTTHEVFGYPGLYVIDGAAVSANIGANPSLTIAALAERAMGLIPEKVK